MSKNQCITRLNNLLRDSSFTNVKKEEIMNSVKQAMAERRLTRIDKINVDEIAKDAASKIKAQKIIDKLFYDYLITSCNLNNSTKMNDTI